MKQYELGQTYKLREPRLKENTPKEAVKNYYKLIQIYPKKNRMQTLYVFRRKTHGNYLTTCYTEFDLMKWADADVKASDSAFDADRARQLYEDRVKIIDMANLLDVPYQSIIDWIRKEVNAGRMVRRAKDRKTGRKRSGASSQE